MPAKYLTKGSLIIHTSLLGVNVGVVYNIDYHYQRAQVHWTRKDLVSYHPHLNKVGYEISHFYSSSEFKIINNEN